jgi:hypothetical protein
MTQTMGQDRRELGTEVAGERIAHLDGRFQVGAASAQDRGQILAGVLPAGEIEGDGVIVDIGQDVGREGALAFGVHFDRRGAARSPQVQHAHRGVIVVEERRLGGLRDQLLQDRLGLLGQGLHQFPLRGSGQGHSQTLLEFGQPVVRHPAAVTQQSHRYPHTGRVLFGSRLGRRWGGEHLPASVAAPACHPITGGRDRWCAHDPQDDGGGLLLAHSALRTMRTVRAALQLGMGDGYPTRAGVIPGLGSTVSRRLGLAGRG